MAKRQLTKQQRQRISRLQRDRADRVEADNNFDNDEDSQLGPEQEGLVVARFGSQLDLVEKTTACQGKAFRCHIRANLDSIVVGDRVAWREAADGLGVVVAVLQRDSEFLRLDSQQQLKASAANLDQILVVVAPKPKVSQGLIDRYLIAAETMGLPAVLVANKLDALDEHSQPAFENLLQLYRSIGYPVIETSTKTLAGLDILADRLKHHTSAFLGQSGVGKSSLTQALLPDLDIRVGALSAASGKGTHTTTTAQLFFLPGGGTIIDSPGIREFKLWPMDNSQLGLGFIEFKPFLGHCKYRNCSHIKEPGCALQMAVEQGDIAQGRLDSYRAIAADTGTER